MSPRFSSLDAAASDIACVELSNGVRMAYAERGRGPLVVFVHGSLCDYRYWRPQLDGLSARYRCVAVSLTHYWPLVDVSPTQPFSWSRHADELAEFIDLLGAGPAHVVAHSRGGGVAFHCALRHARHLRTLTLADPGGPLVLPGQSHEAATGMTNALRARAAALIEAGETEAGVALFVDSVSRVGSWAKSAPGFRRMALDNAATLPRQFADPMPAVTRDMASDLRCATLLIDGEKSPEIFRRNVEALAQWLPAVRRQTIRGASHGMNLAHPAAFNRHLDAFIGERFGERG